MSPSDFKKTRGRSGLPADVLHDRVPELLGKGESGTLPWTTREVYKGPGRTPGRVTSETRVAVYTLLLPVLRQPTRTGGRETERPILALGSPLTATSP